MKKRLFILFSVALCFMMIMTGCGTTEVNPYGPTSLSVFDFYLENMLESSVYVSGCVSGAKTLDNTDRAKIGVITNSYSQTLNEEVAAMLCIECFNGVGVEESSGERIGYYEVKGERFKVSYNNSEKAYVIESGVGQSLSRKSYSVTKDASVFKVTKKATSNETTCTVFVQYDSTTSNMSIETTVNVSGGTTIKLKKEIIVLKNGEVISRDVITVGGTNNKSIYTVEYLKTIFNAEIKIAKSNAEAERINKDLFDKETYTDVASIDLAGYKIDVDTAEGKYVATKFGSDSAWVA